MNGSKINITFDCFTLHRFWVSSMIRKCIEAVLVAENVRVGCEINVLVTNDRGIQAINMASRKIDRPTDVLSFPMFQFIPGQLPTEWTNYIDPESELCPLGDMALSLERAIAQGNELGHGMKREVGYLTIHSILHLLGYDHLDEGAQKKQMRIREEEIAATIPGVCRKVENK